MVPAVLTVTAAAVLGGGIAADITVIIVIAAVALAGSAIFNGVRNLVSLCELRRD